MISIDFAPHMVELARRNGEAGGLANVEYRVLDAERMESTTAAWTARSADGGTC